MHPPVAYNSRMDRENALLQLATAHAVALRLHAAGAEHESVARALGIPVASVPALLRIAEAKLAALLEKDDTGGELP
jgi:DNA-directed RNA polymerase specialized sigma24 family protein